MWTHIFRGDLEMNEKYLVISLFGIKEIRIPAWKNNDKKNINEPDFRGNGVAVWVNERQVKPTPVEDVL